ncbi:hypothetical protein [Actinomycetospora soli]|uniref:hypothetical protein n=1 Tax=Actinomycetospora soli TaxID=2893887 RepID=UPI001E58111E|nr:hypothetical protein [Actinomycetospora soli]MCD2186446.1 hypothetical protein [Actinomycetospora soli]
MIAGGARRTLLPLVVAVLVLLLGAAGWAPAARAAPDQGPDPSSGPVALALDLTPRVVGPGTTALTVTGRLTNRGPVPVRDLGVRLQRGAPVVADREADRALAGGISPDPTAVAPPLTPVAAQLDPGDSVPLTLPVPLAALALPGPGVYPVVVEVNGTPGTGAPERVAAERFLLPVAGLPGRPAAAPAPTTVSLLYPLTDRPRRLAVPPGAPTLLADDSLAASFAPGGRLSGLVDALPRAAPLGSPAAAATCLAVDADLLETARDMSAGYQVASPTGPRPGVGAAVAGRWLDAVRAAAVGRCVVALPYADADLLATSRGNMSDLTTAARTLGAQRTAALLGVTPVPDTTVPAGGLLDERSLADLAVGGARALVVDGATLTDGVPPGGVGRFAGGAGGSSPLAVATDPLAARALAQSPADPNGTAGGSTVADGALATQDALAVVALRALEPLAVPAPVVLAPPAEWAVDGAAASALLAGVDDLARQNLVVPADLGTLVARAAVNPATPAVALGPGDRAAVSDQSPAVLDEIRAVRDDQRDLLAASRQDRAGAPTPTDYLEPLTGALLRSLSAAGRGDPALQRAAADDVAAQMRTLRGMVRVIQPAGTYSLGSSDAPLLLTVENQLPVAVDVTVALEPTPGVRASPVTVRQVPAFGSYQFQVALDVERAGQFTIDATARTPGGESLGPTARLLLRSTAYGTITVWLTASAAVVLVILASLRVALRVRAARRDRRSRRRRRPGTTPDGRDSRTTDDDRTLQAR